MDMSNGDLLRRCAEIGTSTWSDALDACGIDGITRGLSRRSGSRRVAAFAVTARATAGDRGEFPRTAFGVGEMIAAVGPDQALLVDLGGAEISTFGGLASAAATQRGATAVIIDGGCRDLDEIRHSGLWLASRFVTPTTGKTRLRLDALNGAVTIGGVAAHPGDMVIGDDTGIVVIPSGDIPRVLAEAERILAVDHEMERYIEAGMSFQEAAAKANYIR